MAQSYFRGWKKKNPSSFYFRTPEPKKRPSHQSWFWRLLVTLKNIAWGVFSLVFLLLRWIWKKPGLVKKLMSAGLALALIGFIFFGLVFAYYSFSLPDPNKLASREVPESTKIFDRNGKPLYEIHGEAKRTLIKLEAIPKYAVNAAIAVEDKNFYKHGGISFTGILRAALINLVSRRAKQGGSTITQQFVRNAVLTREKTFARKFKEIVLSLQLERKYSKDEILQLYFNEIPYGSNAYGIQAAAQTFFGKDAKDLNLIEASYLAALPKAPTYYSPYGPRKTELEARADTVLQLMYEQGYITKEQRSVGQNARIEFRKIGRGILAPHFVLYVQDLLAQKYGEVTLREGGFKVTTTLDLDLQQIAEEAIAKQVPQNEKNYNGANAALVALDPKTGQILALVGSRDYFDEENDGAVNVVLRPRQPGSSFKPYVYAAAFKKGFSPATMLMDVVTNFGIFGDKEYIPTNYNSKEYGPVSIRQALQGSLNIPAVKTILLTGIEDAIQTAENLGITTLKDRSRYGPSLVLGGGEIKLLEHTAAFGVFSQNGIQHEVVPILKVEDKNGKLLEEFRESAGQEVLNPQIAYQINHVLSDNEARLFIFTARNNRLTLPGNRPVAAKTGTTQEFRDAWTVGYTPSLVAGVWVGNNDNASMKKGADGLVVAAPIWNEFMRRALEGKPVEEFVRPEGISEVMVDALSGKLPTQYTPSTKTEIFSSFNLPQEEDDVHILGGLKALRSEKSDDPNWEEPIRKWAETNAAAGYIYLPGGKTPKDIDSTIDIQIDAPEKITSLPWTIKAKASSSQSSTNLEIFLDNQLLTSAEGNNLEFKSNDPRVDGEHQLLIQAKIGNNKLNRKILNLEFALGKKLLILSPQDNQELIFPASISVESTQNSAAENANFALRSSSGKEFLLAGPISKRQIGTIYQYTLNASESQKPVAGSYALYAQIGPEKSNEVVIKIP